MMDRPKPIEGYGPADLDMSRNLLADAGQSLHYLSVLPSVLLRNSGAF